MNPKLMNHKLLYESLSNEELLDTLSEEYYDSHLLMSYELDDHCEKLRMIKEEIAKRMKNYNK